MMKLFQRTFRHWWQIPRRYGEHEEDRRVTFLELFYDLVYVVIIAQLSHTLAKHVDAAGLGQFVFLFILVWWAWLNGTLYHDYHGNNDIRTRVFTFLQMFTVGAMAVFAHNALGDGAQGFAISYAAFLFILTFLWWRSGIHDADHRPLSTPYSATFLITTILFFASAFLPDTWRFWLWGIGLALSLFLPLTLLLASRNNKAALAQLAAAPAVNSSVIERFGLITIIVLGEVIVAVVNGVASHHHLSWPVGVMAALGMLIAIGIWWLYFDFIQIAEKQ